MNDYVLKRRTLVIRHTSGDRIVALLEIVSPGNKSAQHAIRSFVEKAVEALYRGYHLLIVDLFPVGPRDPNGLHALIWGEISDVPFTLPEDEPLTLAAYSAGPVKRAYVEPTAVGRELIVRRDEHNFRQWSRQRRRDRESVHLRHLHIEKHHVGPQTRDRRNRLRAVPRFVAGRCRSTAVAFARSAPSGRLRSLWPARAWPARGDDKLG